MQEVSERTISLQMPRERRNQMINTLEYESSTIKVTTKLSNGQVVIFSSTHYVRRVVTQLAPEKSPESLAVEWLREGEMCSL